ncbi:MAG: DNA-binding domain-containing protein [Lawsonibacter sp.]|nr:DNA-binding domain-containing protein [Lawsonibacter sp.]
MRIYIIEDDITVISILEDIVERNSLGSICGDTSDGPPDLDRILAVDPDLILVDLLMQGKDGIQVVRELREKGCLCRFIMISQVSSKEMIAKAYSAGVDFFIQKPINLIEVRQVIGSVIRQIENERALTAIQSVFTSRAPIPQQPQQERKRRRLKYILSQLGMAGEKGSQDILDLCTFLLERGETVSQVGVSALCAQLSDTPKTLEQRARRAVEHGLSHIASIGLEDYNNEFFVRYAARLFPFQEVRAEMAHLQGKGPGGKANLKTFLDGLLVLFEDE